MSIEDIVSFFVTLLILFFISGGARLFTKKKPQVQEELEEEEGEEGEEPQKARDPLHDFLESLDAETEEEKSPPPPPPPPPRKKPVRVPTSTYRTVKDEFKFQTDLDKFKQRTAIQERQLKIAIEDPYKDTSKTIVSSEMLPLHKKAAQAKGKKLLQNLPSKKQMIIINEILTPIDERKKW